MDNLAAYDILIYMFEHIDVLMLIFVRVIAFFIGMPIISSQNVFMQGRLFLALCVSVALFMSGRVTTVYYMDTTLGYVYLILIEFLVGMALGYVVLAIFNLIFFAGQLMDFQIGLMMVNVLDPMTQVQVPVTGNLFYFGMMAMLVVTGGIHALFVAFFQSYQVVPIGTAFIVGNQPLAWYIVLLLTESMILAVRLAMPIIGTMMLINIALGIMVKTTPQMNIFVVGLPMKLLIGILLIWMIMIPNLGAIFGQVLDMAGNSMREAVWGMETIRRMGQ